MAEKTKLWYLENFNLFKGLNEENKEELKQITSMRQLSKNVPIYFASDPLHLLPRKTSLMDIPEILIRPLTSKT